jgi:hypothetical protein
MVDAPDVSATGDPTGEAIGDAAGEPTGDACGLAIGEAAGRIAVAALVGIGAGVFVGSFGDESPPHAPTMTATSSKTSSVLHEEDRILPNVIPCPVGPTASIHSVRGIVPKSGKRPETMPGADFEFSESSQVNSDFMVELGTAESTSFGIENHSRSSRYSPPGSQRACPRHRFMCPFNAEREVVTA